MTEAEDSRARFRHLPEPIRLDEMVETADVNRTVEHEPLVEKWREALLGPGTP